MSQSRPTLSSPSRECPVVDGVRQIQRIAVRNAEVGAFRSTAHCQPGKGAPSVLVLSRSRRADGIQR